MRYQVIWSGQAMRQLAAIWLHLQQSRLTALSPALERLVSRELQAVADASTAIDRLIERTPLTAGRPHHGSLFTRILAAGPLEVGYDVHEGQMHVFVVVVADLARRN